jgi:ribosomal protein S18 acetylase RimI-like enzyme
MSSWHIRDAGPGDAEAIAQVHVRAWQAAYRGILSEEVIRAHAQRRRPYWTSYLGGSSPDEHVLVAVAGGPIRGFAVAGPSGDEDANGGEAEVRALYVDPYAWGRGIGSSLLGALLDRLRLDRFRSATLWVLADNSGARRFYEARGWALDGAERIHPDRGVAELRYRSTLTATGSRR